MGSHLLLTWMSAWQRWQEEVEEEAGLMEGVEGRRRRMMSSIEPPSFERMASSPERLSSNGLPHSQAPTSFQTVCSAAT